MKLRLHQFLSKCGVFSSKNEVKQAIWDGDITIGDRVAKDMKFQFNPANKEVRFRGELLTLPNSNSYFLLNKPAGVICSRLNQQEKKLGKKSVYDIFRAHVSNEVYETLVTVGRLDEDTTGFLLVTTDGDVVHKITSPKHHISKTYRVTCSKKVTGGDVQKLKSGVEVTFEESGITESYQARPAHVERISSNEVLLTINEGKKRQIRRMFSSLGNEVTQLHRVSTENMALEDYKLKQGEFCSIDSQEIDQLILFEQ